MLHTFTTLAVGLAQGRVESSLSPAMRFVIVRSLHQQCHQQPPLGHESRYFDARASTTYTTELFGAKCDSVLRREYGWRRGVVVSGVRQ